MITLKGGRWVFDPPTYRCPICSHLRAIHIITVTKAPLGEGWVAHVIYKCVYCDAVQEHGVRISDPDLARLREMLGQGMYRVFGAEETYDMLPPEERKVLVEKARRRGLV